MSKRKIDHEERTQLIWARERLGLNVVEFAERLGVVKSTVYRIEAGISHPSLALMQRWLILLGPEAKMDWFWSAAARSKPRLRGLASSPDAAA
jgi:transcriptional regulator with XRE-family HTH domain